MTLRELITAYDANGFFLADSGHDSASGKPEFLFFDDDTDKKYGETKMRKLRTADYFDTTVPEEAEYSSDWIITGQDESRHRIKLFL